MNLYSCGGLGYPRLVAVGGENFNIPLDLDEKYSLFKEGDRVDNGHPVLHIKGTVTQIPKTILIPGMQRSLVLIPEHDRGTYSWAPNLWSGPSGPYLLAGGQNTPIDRYGNAVGLWWHADFADGIINYDPNNPMESNSTYLSGFSEGPEANRCWYDVTNIRTYKNGSPPYISKWRQYGILVGRSDELIPQDTTGLRSIFFGRLNRMFDKMIEGDEPMFHGNYSYVCADACESIRYPHHNVVLNTMEVINLKKSVSDMYASFKELALPATPTKKAKQGASAYLSSLYGPRLTLKEFSEILTHEKSYEKVGTTTGTREVSWFYDTFHFDGVDRVSFSYHFGVYNTAMQALNSWGLSPLSLADVWDAIPYSFVVDWFVNVSDTLENPERRGFIDSLPVSHIWRSEKSQSQGSITDPGGSSLNYTIQVYAREYCEELRSQLNGYTPSSGVTAQGHIPELSAVLVNTLV